MFSSHFCETATVFVRVLRPSKTMKLHSSYSDSLTVSQSPQCLLASYLSPYTLLISVFPEVMGRRLHGTHSRTLADTHTQRK